MPVFTGEAFFVDRITNPNAQSAASPFNQKHKLRNQTLTATANRIVPIVLPNC
ncbi:MAG TPA: hypothetical protein VHR27_02040 [Blastocatellia bacterium]|nr:hypothetical protein [Blastocatellia bacterium]